ncbi:spermidine/putrescine ABC transporter membrane protein [Salmonella enterica subsp. enterica serovar Newport str. SHSN001]|nr:spermidine/putrescine ABC transporter membrane protein [Salmonella enterica subsp. enterica serovar Newport str. SHSN001]
MKNTSKFQNVVIVTIVGWLVLFVFLPNRQMRRIGLYFRLLKLLTAGIIKCLHQPRITGESFRRCHVFNPMLFPKAIRRAKRTNTRLCRNSCTCKD